MKVLRHIIFLFIFVSSSMYSQVNQPINIGSRHTITSKILNEQRDIIIGLPQNYQPESKSYAVVVLLDGNYHFISTYGTIEYLSKRFLMPEAILVAIPSTNRVKDLTPTNTLVNFDGSEDNSLLESGGGANFLKFIQNEVLVWVEENYSVSSLEVIIGHSWGGLTVTQSFFGNNDKFEKFLAIDPSYWWDDNYFIKYVNQTTKTDISHQDRFFVSASSLDIEKYNRNCCKHRNSIDLFYYTLKNNLSSEVQEQIGLRYFEDEDHASVPVPSTYYGLKFLFKDFPLDDLNNNSIQEIQNHFNDYYAVALEGESVKIPEDLVRNVAQFHLYANQDVEAALVFFKYNIKHYPKSYKAHGSIGNAYVMSKNNLLAKKHLKIALEINPSFGEASDMLRKID